MEDKIEVVTIQMPEFPPEGIAYLEIKRLASNPELGSQHTIGGPTPPVVQEENKRRRQEYERRKLAIIKKYDVKAVYLDPLLNEERRLKSQLAVVQEQIAALQNL